MLFPLYLSSTRLFSFPPTIYLSSCTVPLFSFLTSSSFPLLPLPPLPLHPTLSLISLDPAPPSLSFSIFFSSYSYSTLPSLNVHSLLPPPCFLPLSPLSLPLPPPRSLFIVLHVQLCSGKEEKGRRRRGEKTSSIRLRPPSFANLRVLHLVLLSLRVHLMHPSSGRERCHFGIFVFHLLPSPFESRPITFISIRDPSHFFRPFHGRLFVEAVDSRVQNLIIEKIFRSNFLATSVSSMKFKNSIINYSVIFEFYSILIWK